MGKVLLIGAGPGDPELITDKGLKYVKSADVIIYDKLVNTQILCHAKSGCELIYVGKENTSGGKLQEYINELLVKKASVYGCVVRLKGGDPFLFGRGGEEIEELIRNNIGFEVIPGVTSAISVPAYAGIPVTHRKFASSLHVFTGHKTDENAGLDFQTIARIDGTLVFLMALDNLDYITKGLIGSGKNKNTPAAIIENGTMPAQKILIGTLENICHQVFDKRIKPPAVVVIGDVVTLSEIYHTPIKKSLTGKKIIVTATNKTALEFCGKLGYFGAQPIAMPLTETKEIEYEQVDLKKFAGLLFNSANAVRYFLKNIVDIRMLSGLKIGVVGSGTEKELEKHRIKADFKPEIFTVNDALKKATYVVNKGEKVLVVTSSLSPFDAERSSAEFRLSFKKLAVYETVRLNMTNEMLASVFTQSPDVMTFFSGSAVDCFFESAGKEFKDALSGTIIASIGSETTKAINAHGYKAEIEAREFSSDGLINAILKYYGGTDETI